MVVGRGGAAGGVAPGSQRFPQEGSLQLSRVGASARQGRRSFLFTPIPKGGLLIYSRGAKKVGTEPALLFYWPVPVPIYLFTGRPATPEREPSKKKLYHRARGAY